MRLPGVGMGWKEFFNGLKEEISKDGITDLAASMTLLRDPRALPVPPLPRGARERRHHSRRRAGARRSARAGRAGTGDPDRGRADPAARGAAERDARRVRRRRRDLGRVGRRHGAHRRAQPLLRREGGAPVVEGARARDPHDDRRGRARARRGARGGRDRAARRRHRRAGRDRHRVAPPARRRAHHDVPVGAAVLRAPRRPAVVQVHHPGLGARRRALGARVLGLLEVRLELRELRQDATGRSAASSCSCSGCGSRRSCCSSVPRRTRSSSTARPRGSARAPSGGATSGSRRSRRRPPVGEPVLATRPAPPAAPAPRRRPPVRGLVALAAGLAAGVLLARREA